MFHLLFPDEAIKTETPMSLSGSRRRAPSVISDLEPDHGNCGCQHDWSPLGNPGYVIMRASGVLISKRVIGS